MRKGILSLLPLFTKVELWLCELSARILARKASLDTFPENSMKLSQSHPNPHSVAVRNQRKVDKKRAVLGMHDRGAERVFTTCGLMIFLAFSFQLGTLSCLLDNLRSYSHSSEDEPSYMASRHGTFSVPSRGFQAVWRCWLGILSL